MITPQTMPTSLSEALAEIRTARRACEIMAAQCRGRREHAQARYYNGKVDAYDVAESLIVAVRDARSYS